MTIIVFRYECRTCGLVEDRDGLGACAVCVQTCHKDHDVAYVRYSGISTGSCFCDCGAGEGSGVCSAMPTNDSEMSQTKNDEYCEGDIKGEKGGGDSNHKKRDSLTKKVLGAL